MSNDVLTILTICVPTITALISGIITYMLSVRNSNKEIEKVKEQHKNDLESMKENHRLEMEKLKLQQKHEKEMKNQDFIEQLGANFINKIVTSSKMQNFIDQEMEKAFNRKEKKTNGD